MTNREYIVSLFSGMTIPEAFFADMQGVDLNAQYYYGNGIGKAVVDTLAGLITAPKVKSVSENGFSMTWDTQTLGRYYLWLCKKFGITPENDVILASGLHAIIDISDTW